jgi:hypothetical protein
MASNVAWSLLPAEAMSLSNVPKQKTVGQVRVPMRMILPLLLGDDTPDTTWTSPAGFAPYRG